MEAIILAGGMGSRLQPVINGIPKPMAPIGAKPFLSFMLDSLAAQGIKKVILCTGYKHAVVENYYHKGYKGVELLYSVEDFPLGTGGAIRKAIQYITAPIVVILNGDTLFKVALPQMHTFHVENQADLTMALKKMADCSRYGMVETVNGQVTRFREKMPNQAGTINGGIYLLNRPMFKKLEQLPEKFSFEKDFLEVFYPQYKIMGFQSDAYFIDIGIPTDYVRAQNELIADP